MLRAFGRAFRTPDLRKKILFTLAIMGLFRLGSVVPAPGVNYQNIHACIDASKNSSIYGLVNLFSGGALLQLSVFALGIMPYITSSIIIQLLIVVIPRLERLKEQGQAGQAKLTQYTRYLTIALAILQSTGIVALARSASGAPSRLFPTCDKSLLYSTSVFRVATLVVVMTAGTAVIMWLGELITDRGIGNGMSLLIFTSIASRFPSQGSQILQTKGATTFVLVCILGLMIIAEPKNSPHATAVGLTADALRAAFGSGWLVREQDPVALDDESEPEPDVIVVPGRRRDYSHAHPERPALIVEVADSSMSFDRRYKGSLYARAGIADYWIVNLVDRRLEVRRDPTPTGYRAIVSLATGDEIAPLAAAAARIAVASLLP